MAIALGILGGSGLYAMEGLERARQVAVKTPFGDPSGRYTVGRLGGVEVCFLPRHGPGHRLTPSEVNSRANIWGFKKLGVERLLAFSAVGSLRESIEPGDMVVPDQLVDRTSGRREASFFGDGVVAHVAFADPMCSELSDLVYAAATAAGGRIHKGGSYVCIEGPAFSTRAESNLYRQWGLDIVGMTALPEAKLAREAELCFSTVSLVTDFDCWHEVEADISVPAVLEVLRRNTALAQALIRAVAAKPALPRLCGCGDSLKDAILTDPAQLSAAARRRLDLLIGHRLPAKKPKKGKKRVARPARRR